MPSETIWKPDHEESVRVLTEQNPWHGTGAVSAELAPEVERPLTRVLWRALESGTPRRFHVLLGPRRVGKSTAMYQTVRHLLKVVPRQRLWRMSLDHPSLSEEPLGELMKVVIGATGANAAEPAYLFLDELTYAKDWDRWLKTAYDDRWPVRVVGSSSSVAALRQRRTESGVGRWEEHDLPPYSFREFLELAKGGVELPGGETLAAQLRACAEARVALPDLDRLRRTFLLAGGFPELLFDQIERRVDEGALAIRSRQNLSKDAIQRTIYQDIPQAVGVQSPRELERLLYVLAGQVTGMYSPNSIGAGLGISQPTLDRYLGVLERSYLIFTLPNYAATEEARQRRGRKVYFVDGAVRNAALQRESQPLEDPRELGLLIENLAAAHLKALGDQTLTRVFHWRQGDDEVDLVYDHPAEPAAFEVGTRAGHGFGGLRAIQGRFPRLRGRAFYVSLSPHIRAPDAATLEPGLLPLDVFLLACGEQAERAMLRRVGVTDAATGARPGDVPGGSGIQ